MKSKFTDTHCHAFWDFDDGVKTKEEALALLRCAESTGIATLFVTPHKIIDGQYDPSLEQIQAKLDDLIVLRDQNNIMLELKSACEFRIHQHILTSIAQRSFVCYQDTDYLLIEFTRRLVDSRIVADAIHELRLLGVKPIVAHPERYFDTPKQAVDACKRWQKMGVYFQINRTSLMGIHGERADRISWQLVSAGLAHLVASDAHQGEGRRECRLDDVYGMICRRFDQRTAQLLCIDNPRSLYENNDLEPVAVKRPWWYRV